MDVGGRNRRRRGGTTTDRVKSSEACPVFPLTHGLLKYVVADEVQAIVGLVGKRRLDDEPEHDRLSVVRSEQVVRAIPLEEAVLLGAARVVSEEAKRDP